MNTIVLSLPGLTTKVADPGAEELTRIRVRIPTSRREKKKSELDPSIDKDRIWLTFKNNPDLDLIPMLKIRIRVCPKHPFPADSVCAALLITCPLRHIDREVGAYETIQIVYNWETNAKALVEHII